MQNSAQPENTRKFLLFLTIDLIKTYWIHKTAVWLRAAYMYYIYNTVSILSTYQLKESTDLIF